MVIKVLFIVDDQKKGIFQCLTIGAIFTFGRRSTVQFWTLLAKGHSKIHQISPSQTVRKFLNLLLSETVYCSQLYGTYFNNKGKNKDQYSNTFHRQAIITYSMYISNPILEGKKHLFNVFYKRFRPSVRFVFKSGLWWHKFGIYFWTQLTLKTLPIFEDFWQFIILQHK